MMSYSVWCSRGEPCCCWPASSFAQAVGTFLTVSAQGAWKHAWRWRALGVRACST